MCMSDDAAKRYMDKAHDNAANQHNVSCNIAGEQSLRHIDKTHDNAAKRHNVNSCTDGDENWHVAEPVALSDNVPAENLGCAGSPLGSLDPDPLPGVSSLGSVPAETGPSSHGKCISHDAAVRHIDVKHFGNSAYREHCEKN